MTDINKAIKALRPNSSFGVSGDRIKWNDPDNKQPTETEINDKIVELKAEYDALAYSRKRASEYPSNGDQWDMIYKDNKNSTTTHADAVEAVKTKWPKDNSGPV
jgi:hypothetical protein